MSKRKELLIRVYLVTFGVTLFALLLFAKAVKISVFEGEAWRARGEKLYVKYVPVRADRGNILAEDGSLLATSLPFFEIRMDTRANGLSDVVFQKGVDSLAWYLSKYVKPEWSQSRYRDFLIKQRAKSNRYLRIANNVSYPELERIKQFPIFRRGQNKGGLIVINKSRRSKPFGMLAERTIGYLNDDVQVGLEAWFHTYLKGEEGSRLMQKVSGGVWIPVQDQDAFEPHDGFDVQTTLNIRMQDIVQNALLKGLKEHRGDFGTAVIMEVRTGAIKAIANIGKTSYGWAEDYNHAVGKSLEPGSTFKLASVMALMEDKYATPDAKVDLRNGKRRFYNRDMYDSSPHNIRETNMREAFERSSNVGIASLVWDHYGANNKAGQFVARLRQFGLDQTTGIEIPGEGAPFVKEAYNTKQRWSGTTLPWMSIGYEVRLTPLQTLTFYNAVANGGRSMKPYLVTAVKAGDQVKKRFGPKVISDRIATHQTIAHAQALLEGVVRQGTARRQKSDEVSFAGKTGTAVVDYYMGNQGRKQYMASFVGYYPAKDPEYSCMVLIYKPRAGKIYGSDVALPVFREIAEKTMAASMTAVHLVDTAFTNKPMANAQYPHADFADRQDLLEIFNTLGIQVEPLSEDQWVQFDEEGRSLRAVNIENGKVPDLQGMGLRDAMFLLENAGLRVAVEGSGHVIRQSLQPGTVIEKGKQIVLKLG